MGLYEPMLLVLNHMWANQGKRSLRMPHKVFQVSHTQPSKLKYIRRKTDSCSYTL